VPAAATAACWQNASRATATLARPRCVCLFAQVVRGRDACSSAATFFLLLLSVLSAVEGLRAAMATQASDHAISRVAGDIRFLHPAAILPNICCSTNLERADVSHAWFCAWLLRNGGRDACLFCWAPRAGCRRLTKLYPLRTPVAHTHVFPCLFYAMNDSFPCVLVPSPTRPALCLYLFRTFGSASGFLLCWLLLAACAGLPHQLWLPSCRRAFTTYFSTIATLLTFQCPAFICHFWALPSAADGHLLEDAGFRLVAGARVYGCRRLWTCCRHSLRAELYAWAAVLLKEQDVAGWQDGTGWCCRLAWIGG